MRRTFKRLLGGFVFLVCAAALLIYLSQVRERLLQYKNDRVGYMGLDIGASQEEALYVFGYPQHVVEPSEKTTVEGWEGQWSRVYQTDGNDPKNAMPAGKTIKDYSGWEVDREAYRIDLTFDQKTRRVTEIGCYVDRASSNTDCPPLFGVDTQTAEDELTEHLGKADSVSHDGVSKSLRYDGLGLDVTLTQRKVYMMTKHAAKGTPWQWKLQHIFL